MAKLTLKIDQFGGGVNTLKDRRDIADNEANIIVDGNVFTSGKLTLAGGSIPFLDEADKINIRAPGWGLFTFRSDYDIVDEYGLKGGAFLHGNGIGDIAPDVVQNIDSDISADVYMKLYDPDSADNQASGGTLPKVVVRESVNEEWTDLASGLNLYEEEEYVRDSVKPLFSMVKNSLRIADANFKQFGMFTKWFGVVNSTRFIGIDNPNYNDNFASIIPDWNRVNAWLYTHAECKAPTSIQDAVRSSGNLLSTVLTTETIQYSDTGFDVTSGSSFEQGDIIRINDEIMHVSSISSNTLTVRRALFGSDKQAHDNGSKVYLAWRQQDRTDLYDSPSNYSPFTWGHFVGQNPKTTKLDYREHACQVIATDFTNSDDVEEMYEIETPMLAADQFISTFNTTTYDSSTTEAHGSFLGWGVATDSISTWAREYAGIQFMYEFTEQDSADQLEDSWLKGNKFRFYASLIYDGEPGIMGQESAMTDITPINSNVLNKNANLYCCLVVKWTGINKDHTKSKNLSIAESGNNDEDTWAEALAANARELYINPRVTGCRIYYSSSEDNDQNKFLLMESWFDENGGIRRQGGGSYMPWCPVNYGNSTSQIADQDTGDVRKLAWYRVSAKSDLFDGHSNFHCLNLYKASGSKMLLGPELIANALDRTFLLQANWANRSSSNDFDTFSYVSIGADEENDLFDNNYLKVVDDGTDASNEKGGELDEAFFGSMTVGKTYRLSYNIEITAFASGTVRVGIANDSYTFQAVREYPVADGTITPQRHFVDFVYSSSCTKILIEGDESTGFTAYFDEFSLKQVKDATQNEAFYFQAPPGGETYDGMNGHEGDITNVLYKTSTEVNGIRYVGHVAYPVEWRTYGTDIDASFTDMFKGKIYGDRMIRSAAGQPDVFAEEGFIDAVVNDGESIVHLASLGSYLLQFKENTLYVINVAISEKNSVVESLAGTYKYKGVTQPYHVTDIDDGIVWINKFGMFLFNGEQVIDLMKDKLKLATWEWSDNKSIGYDQVERCIVIIDDITDSVSKSTGWLYYIDQGGWTRTSDKYFIAGLKSNFIHDKDGNLVFSTFNSDVSGVTVNGLKFSKEAEEGRHIITTVDSTPEDENGDSVDFTSNAFSLSNNAVILLSNTGLNNDIVSSRSMQFTHFKVPSDTNNTLIMRELSTDTFLGVGDFIHFGYFTIQPYFWFEGETKIINGITGYWEVTHVDFEHTNEHGDHANTLTPSIYTMVKRTQIGTGTDLDELTFDDGNPDANFEFEFVSSGNVSNPLLWRTVQSNHRKSIEGGLQYIPDNLYFDGAYRINEVIDSVTLDIDKNFGEGRYGYNMDTNKLFKYARLYQDFHDVSNPHSTVKSVLTVPNDFEVFGKTNMQKWDRNPVSSSFFNLLTKDIDFGDPSIRKKIYRVYICYSQNNLSAGIFPRVRVFLIATTKDGVFNVFPNVEQSQNYGLFFDEGLSRQTYNEEWGAGYIETLDITSGETFTQDSSKVATIVFNDPDKRLNNALSIQVGFINAGKSIIPPDPVVIHPNDHAPTPYNFEVNDISIVYRNKNVR